MNTLLKLCVKAITNISKTNIYINICTHITNSTTKIATKD